MEIVGAAGQQGIYQCVLDSDVTNAYLGNNLYFTSGHKLMHFDITLNDQPSTVAGNEEGYKDGPGTEAKFRTPYGLCLEGKTIFLTDPSCSRIVLICPLDGTKLFMSNLGKVYDAYGIHVRYVGKKTCISYKLVTNFRELIPSWMNTFLLRGNYKVSVQAKPQMGLRGQCQQRLKSLYSY